MTKLLKILPIVLIVMLTACGEHNGSASEASNTTSSVSETSSTTETSITTGPTTTSDPTGQPTPTYPNLTSGGSTVPYTTNTLPPEYIDIGGTRLQMLRSEEVYQIMQGASRKSIDELISRSYPQNDIISKILFAATLQNFNFFSIITPQFPAECIRVFDDGSMPYVVYKLSEGGLFFVFYNVFTGSNLPENVSYAFIVKQPLTKNSFNSIKAGDTLTDVEKIDPSSKLFNETNGGWGKGMLYFGETYHMVKEGFMRITYEVNEDIMNTTRYDSDKYTVKKIEFIPNGSNVLRVPDTLSWDYPPEETLKYTFLPQDYPD
ncbi:MAG: hypothetical protein FWE80_05280 [Oscillospiraceae bacterium]|nr:hypothetical protein [Oscillospiraceae bacterium]